MEIKKVVNSANDIMVKRTSIRKYDTSCKITRDEMKNILQDAMTAPSSLNLQPWRFVVIDTEEGKKLIKPYMMFNEEQWETSSAMIAVYGDMDNAANVERIYEENVKHGLVTKEKKDMMVEMIGNYRKGIKQQKNHRK